MKVKDLKDIKKAIKQKSKILKQQRVSQVSYLELELQK